MPEMEEHRKGDYDLAVVITGIIFILIVVLFRSDLGWLFWPILFFIGIPAVIFVRGRAAKRRRVTEQKRTGVQVPPSTEEQMGGEGLLWAPFAGCAAIVFSILCVFVFVGLYFAAHVYPGAVAIFVVAAVSLYVLFKGTSNKRVR